MTWVRQPELKPARCIIFPLFPCYSDSAQVAYFCSDKFQKTKDMHKEHSPVHRPTSCGSQGQAEQLLAQHLQQGCEDYKGLLRNTACVPGTE